MKPHHERKYLDVPTRWVKRYNCKKNFCKFRNEAWDFTVHTFYNKWKDSGYIDKIGRRPGTYRMVRLDPNLPWSPTNTTIVPSEKLLYRNLKVMWKRSWGKSSRY